MMLQTATRNSATSRIGWFGMLRVQIVFGTLAAVALPTVVRADFDLPSAQSGGSLVTGIACFLAMALGAVLFRRLKTFPGFRSYEYVFPSFLASYGVVVAVLLVGRFDYVRSTLIASLMLSIATFFAFSFLNNRAAVYLFAVVPGGNVDKLMQMRAVEWHRMVEPVLPGAGYSGIVADLRADLSDDWERMLADAALAGTPVYHVKQLVESMTGQVEIEHISENSFGALLPNEGYGKLKRAVDFLTALVCIPLLLPLGVLLGLVIRLESPGPALFRQERVGFRGKPFMLIKFRTMRVMEEREGENQVRDAMTQANDARVTRIGRFLRRTRIDEIPQIINILRGQMSWIGPRPEAIPLSRWYQRELPYYSYRHVVRPGITGWAQVNQGHVVDLHDVHGKLCYDFYYLKYVSAWLDALILLRTVRTVLFGNGWK